MHITNRNSRHVALALSSGGARGYAHIGAIEELLRQGFSITSVAGTSMGALVGGMYAAGHLDEVSKWLQSLNRWQVLSLAEPTLSKSHLANADRVLDAMRQIVPDVRIEHLPIPYRAVATDVRNQQEVVFDHGSLYDAIRASISIPSFFKPVERGGRLLMDGGLVNPLPVSRLVRTEGDLLVAISVNAPFSAEVEKCRKRAEQMYVRDKMGPVQRRLSEGHLLKNNHISLISDAISTSIVHLTRLTLQSCRPDIVVEMPVNRFDGTDYYKAQRIIRYGKRQMREAIIAYRLLAHESSY